MRQALNEKHFSSSISCPRRKVDSRIISIKTHWMNCQPTGKARASHCHLKSTTASHSQPRFCNAPLPHFPPIPCWLQPLQQLFGFGWCLPCGRRHTENARAMQFPLKHFSTAQFHEVQHLVNYKATLTHTQQISFNPNHIPVYTSHNFVINTSQPLDYSSI